MRLRCLVIAGLIAACGGNRPLVSVGCTSDDICDPGDSCVDGQCQGNSHGVPDAGGSTPDAGVRAGRLVVQPASIAITAQAGQRPAPAVFDLSDDGDTPIEFAASCDAAVTATPSSGSLAPHATASVTLGLPVWTQPGQQKVECAATFDATQPPVKFSVLATITAAPPSVGPDGGTVDLLDFTLTGDTRPPFCDLTFLYPQQIIRTEVLQMTALAPQFALDLGDHMFVCTESAATANAQMQLYVNALSGFSKPFFMTMGNHECLLSDCSGTVGTLDANYQAYLAALKQVSKHDLPYYQLDFHTRLGLARILFVADNVQSAQQQAWLDSAMAEADRTAKYTIVAKHHPVTGSRMGPLWAWQTISQHKYTLLLTAHSHDYAHDTAALAGRSVICGLGGASSTATGFCRVVQLESGDLRLIRYDLSGNPLDSWSVGPQ
jgi:hypothetical protein